jgi:predicted DsbA family dithiol-disulfide isomerase
MQLDVDNELPGRGPHKLFMKLKSCRTEHANISKREVIVPIAERFGISASDVETAWHDRRFSPTVDAFIEDGLKVGVRGVSAMGWPNRRAIVGLMPPTELVLRLRNEATE